jgi:hypothetical protein
MHGAVPVVNPMCDTGYCAWVLLRPVREEREVCAPSPITAQRVTRLGAAGDTK